MSFTQNNIKPVISKVSTAGAVAQVGAIIDTKDFNEVVAWVKSGTITDGNWTLTVEESSSASFASDVSTCTLRTAVVFAAANDNVSKWTDVVRTKRYIRMTLTPDGTVSTGGTFIQDVVLSGANPAPVQ